MPDSSIEIAGLFIYAYLIGAVPTAFIIGKLVSGIDIRRYGSGNVGGANVFYHVGKGWLVPLGLFEIFIKGASPVWIGQHILNLDLASSPALIVAPLLAISGHNWSIYLKFHGGRGVAVASGTLLALSPLLLSLFIIVAVPGWILTRSAGIWVLISMALLPLWVAITGGSVMLIWYCIGMLALVVLKRVTANWDALPQDLPRKKVILNRIFRDRDVDNRSDWIQRVPH